MKKIFLNKFILLFVSFAIYSSTIQAQYSNNSEKLSETLNLRGGEEIENQELIDPFTLTMFKSMIEAVPSYYFDIIEALKAENDKEAIKEIKKALPSLDIWQSIIYERPGQYPKIISNLTASGDDEMVRALERMFYKKEHCVSKLNSITEILGDRLYIDNKISEKYNVSYDLIQQFIETILYETLKDHNEIFDILHAIALNLENDLNFAIYLTFDENNLLFKNTINENKTIRLGHYSSSSNSLKIVCDFSDILDLKGILVHEITHKLMDILYNNSSAPYRLKDKKAIHAYKKAINEIKEKIEVIKEEYDYDDSIGADTGNELYDDAINLLIGIANNYKPEAQILEYVVIYPQLIASEKYNDDQVKELMKPLVNYWNQYVMPDIKNYIDEHGGKSRFISDWEQETIVSPFILNIEDPKGLLFKIEFINYIIGSLQEEGELEAIEEVKKALWNKEVWVSLRSKYPAIDKILSNAMSDDEDDTNS